MRIKIYNCEEHCLRNQAIHFKHPEGFADYYMVIMYAVSESWDQVSIYLKAISSRACRHDDEFSMSPVFARNNTINPANFSSTM